MRTILTLVELIADLRAKNIDIIWNEDSNSRYTELFNLILEGEITCDEDAAQLFFDKNVNSAKYRKFKSIFKQKLLNNLFFLDDQHQSLHDYQKAALRIQKRWSAILILFQRGQSLIATQMSEQLINTAMKYELTDLVVAMLTHIKAYHATQSGDLKKYEYYKVLHARYNQLYQTEITARDRYESIRIHYAKTETYQPTIAAKAYRHYQELAPALEKEHTAELHFLTNMLLISSYLSNYDYKNTVDTCRECLKYFSKKPFEYLKGISIVSDIEMAACIQLKKYEEGLKAGRYALEMNTPGSTNWYLTLANHILLSFHCNQFNRAFLYYKEAFQAKAFKDLPDKIKEKYKLYEAYLFLLTSAGKIKNIREEDFPKKGKFRIGKFLNEIPIFQQDKSGLNIPVLIVQILYLLTQQKFDAVIDKIQAIELYRYRHLRKNNTLYRANYFIQALIELPKAGFHRNASIRKAEKFFQKLKEVPIEKANQSYVVEVIPFEFLWDFALENLPYKRVV